MPYLTQAAMINPDAMIRMGEVQEQGFYGVKKNSKRADFYYKEGIRILSLLASQGLPSAAVSLGHVYIEGLGTKQDIPRAEKFYKFAEKAGYEDPEFRVWQKYGITLRQVTIPEELKKGKSKEKARTCMYLVREKEYAYSFAYNYSNGHGYNSCINASIQSTCSEMLNMDGGFSMDTNKSVYTETSVGPHVSRRYVEPRRDKR